METLKLLNLLLAMGLMSTPGKDLKEEVEPDRW